jgi:hypothetical protein
MPSQPILSRRSRAVHCRTMPSWRRERGATIGGEVVKVLLLESWLPREQAMAMVVINKASSTLAKMC